MDKQGGRQVPLQVLSLGMSRTGTTSMREAFRILGYHDVHHGFDMVDKPLSSNAWEKAVDAKFYGKGGPCDRAMFDELLGHCAATTDGPCAFFWEELVECYPEVRISLQSQLESAWCY